MMMMLLLGTKKVKLFKAIEFMGCSLSWALEDIPDPRRAQGKRYPLDYLLLFTVLALLSGARSYRGIITFLEQRRGLLNDHLGDQKAAQTLTAFASPSAIVLAHTEIDEKSNEIPAAEQMIHDLGLCGVVFTADAMHCQKNL